MLIRASEDKCFGGLAYTDQGGIESWNIGQIIVEKIRAFVCWMLSYKSPHIEDHTNPEQVKRYTLLAIQSAALIECERDIEPADVEKIAKVARKAGLLPNEGRASEHNFTGIFQILAEIPLCEIAACKEENQEEEIEVDSDADTEVSELDNEAFRKGTEQFLKEQNNLFSQSIEKALGIKAVETALEKQDFALEMLELQKQSEKELEQEEKWASWLQGFSFDFPSEEKTPEELGLAMVVYSPSWVKAS